jgi:hypothetical protein
MNAFDAKFISKRVADFSRLVCECSHAAPTDGKADLPVQFANIEKTLVRTIDKISGWQMGRTKRTLEDILKEVRTKELLAPALAIHARTAMKAVTEELHARKFLYVAPDFTDFVNQAGLFGDQVWERFASARPDIRDAGNCLAAECSTAAVFHLMRAVEWGLRALCVHVGLKKLKVIRKTGAFHFKPLTEAQWGELLRELKTKIDAKLAKTKRTAKHHADSEFYLPLWQDIQAFKDAYRNHVMHARREYTPTEAIAVFDRVRRFMNLLATRVSES